MDGAQDIEPVMASPDLPSRLDAACFAAKACLLRLQRAVGDLRDGPQRHRRGIDLADAPVAGHSSVSLWPSGDDDAMLTAGKVQNLRVAMSGLDGVVVPAGQVLGFWRQVGRASARRGFVVGRELREGCLVPSVGGGLCQLSNALYDAALSAGLEIVERHAHSRIVPGSQAMLGRDATVFWNYIDLRLRATHAWRIDVAMDAQTLRVAIRSLAPRAGSNYASGPTPTRASSNACHACDRSNCWRHAAADPLQIGRTWIQEPHEWPEFAIDRASRRAAIDRVVVLDIADASLPRRLWRRWRERDLPLVKRRLAERERQSGALARQLHFTDRCLVIPQALLVPCWRAGLLAGRRFEVMMTQLPASALQAQLDRAAACHPDSATLVDFRVDARWCADETAALTHADAWITPHRGVLALAGRAGVALPWRVPMIDSVQVECRRTEGEALQVLFPASPLARKGIHALRTVLQGNGMTLLLPPGAQELPDFWRGCRIRQVASIEAGLAEADVVVLPAWVEHQPRGVLLALARGVPVIATAACGLPADGRWREIPAGDARALEAALQAVLRHTTLPA